MAAGHLTHKCLSMHADVQCTAIISSAAKYNYMCRHVGHLRTILALNHFLLSDAQKHIFAHALLGIYSMAIEQKRTHARTNFKDGLN